MPHIYVDPVVMAYLHELTALGDAYNSSIRNHLGLPAAPRVAETTAAPPVSLPLITTVRPGALWPLIASGNLAVRQTPTGTVPSAAKHTSSPSTAPAGSSPPTARCSAHETCAPPPSPATRARVGATGEPRPARPCSSYASRKQSRSSTTPHPTNRPPTRQRSDPSESVSAAS